jgi:hypothetical protein
MLVFVRATIVTLVLRASGSVTLIIKNQTTNEDLKKVYQNKRNNFDRVSSVSGRYECEIAL